MVQPLKNYSQNDEQRAILAAFNGRTDGRYLDIGGYHAFDKSNTRALYELGWSGVIIEPAPVPFADLLSEYANDPRVTLINAAAALDHEPVYMHLTKDAVSTSVEAVYERWKNAVKYDTREQVETVLIEDIYRVHGPFDFVSIDAEGMSPDFFIHRFITMPEEIIPHCICVEYDNKLEEILKRACERRYTCTYTSSENVVLVRA